MKAIVLLSGGLDSTVVLAMALERGLSCIALSFDYGQRHKIELQAAKKIATHYNVPHKMIMIEPSAFGSSALVTDELPHQGRSIAEMQRGSTPNTYVPARNTLFLSFALAQAEIHEASEIHMGPNALDGKYPDCSPAYIQAYQNLIQVATKQALDGNAPKLVAPLLYMNKVEIIQEGLKLKAPIELTHSCYSPTTAGLPCNLCDACILRTDAFCKLSNKITKNNY